MSRHNSIQSRAMLAALRISKWTATRTDKKVTEEVAIKHGVSSKRAGTYRKHAIDVEHASYRAVNSAISQLRVRHFYWTLPWGEDGARILPAANFDKFSADMRTLRAQFDSAVTQFCIDYPSLAQKARSELGTMFDPSDYPRDISSKFDCEVNIMPLPDANDFRVDLPDDAIEDIRQNITKEMQRTTTEAMRDAYSRLFDHVHRIVEKLGDPAAIFQASTIENLRDLCELLGALNITGDPQLEEFRERARTMIDGVDAQVIRDMPEKRSDIAEQAKQIESDMAAFMGVQS
jgi:hypothetical protein